MISHMCGTDRAERSSFVTTRVMQMRLLFWLVPLLLSSLCAEGYERLPPEVISTISNAKKDCSESSKLEKGFLTRRDINGDGVEDFVLDYGKFRCGDGTMLSCGTAGCLT